MQRSKNDVWVGLCLSFLAVFTTGRVGAECSFNTALPGESPNAMYPIYPDVNIATNAFRSAVFRYSGVDSQPVICSRDDI
jgi:hypothetical protein